MAYKKLTSSRLYPAVSWVWHTLVPTAVRSRMWKIYWDHTREEYQQLQFGGKTYIKGIDRSPLYNQLFPSPPVGKSILDVGSNVGYYAMRALLEGANRCTAIELDRRCVEKARKVANKLNLQNIEFLNADIFETPIHQDYDIVLCLNLLHHFSTLERVEEVLEKLYSKTREKIILAFPIPAGGDQLYAIDDELSVTGVHFIRLSPRYFLEKYQHDDVKVMEAVEYPGRWVAVITKHV